MNSAERMKERMKMLSLILIAILMLMVGTILINDWSLYRHNVESNDCCGWVDPSPVSRPITHALVDWSKPKWKLNAVGLEEWLVSDGIVDDKIAFFTVWKRRDPETKSPLN